VSKLNKLSASRRDTKVDKLTRKRRFVYKDGTQQQPEGKLLKVVFF
jgi:hypothetical protein